MTRRTDHGRSTVDFHPQLNVGRVENWRANVPLFRTIATSISILLSVAWLTYQGSNWAATIQSEMRELRGELRAVSKSNEEKATIKEVEFRFALQCARAPVQHKQWVCGEGQFTGPSYRPPVATKVQ